MASKAKIELTANSVRQAITDGKSASMTQLAHQLGYRGSVSSTLTKKLRAILPCIDGLLAANRPTKDGKDAGAASTAPKTAKAVKSKPSAKSDDGKPSAKPKSGKWPRHPANNFREGSSYGTCFDILAAPAHKDGMPREKLIDMLAKATNKDIQHASFDCQVVCSARMNDVGDPFQGPRNRSCKFGFYVERVNSHVRLVLPAATAAKEQP